MAHKRQKALQVAERRAEIARLYLSGKTQMEIAAAVEWSQPIVSRDLKAIKEQWRESAIRDFDEHQAEVLAGIRRVRAEASEAWARSKADDVGDPRFLDQIQKTLIQERDLCGLDAPKRTEVSGPDGGPIGLARHLTDDQLAEIILRHGTPDDGTGSHDRIAPAEASAE